MADLEDVFNRCDTMGSCIGGTADRKRSKDHALRRSGGRSLLLGQPTVSVVTHRQRRISARALSCGIPKPGRRQKRPAHRLARCRSRECPSVGDGC